MKPSAVRQLLRDLDFRPRKTLGQNFLVDRNVRQAHLDAAGINGEDVVLEIGPGLGALTEGLISHAGAVIAVEKDPRLYDYLSRRLSGAGNLTLIHADMLDLDPGALRSGDGAAVTRVVANLPYAAGSRILVLLMQSPDPPVAMHVTVQLEVAERLCAEPDSESYGMLSCWAQRCYTVKRVRRISPGCFYPEPEVVSAIVAFTRHAEHHLSRESERIFYALTKFAFGQRRKQLVSSLGRAAVQIRCDRKALETFLDARGLSPKARPEQLGAGHWCALATAIADGQLR